MHVYYVSDTVNHRYYGTLAEAHTAAKEPTSLTDGTGFRRDWIRIELVDVPTDKASIIKMLNLDELDQRTLKQWILTPRGGLMIAPPEDA